MKNWVPSFFKKQDQETGQEAEPSRQGMLTMQTELQGTRLALAASAQTVERLTREVGNLRARQEEQLQDGITARLEELFQELAAPIAQLATQAYLVEQLQRPVQARDILILVRRLTRVLEKQGLALQGTPGQQVAYDPNLHSPLSMAHPLAAGQPAVIRIPGIAFSGKLLARAGVESAEGLV